MTGMDHPTVVQLEGLRSRDFARRVAVAEVYLVNVHVPPDQSIKGTDAFISYDTIVPDGRIPDNRSAPVLLYCKTGQMPRMATGAIRNAGYGDVNYLEGGTDAWERARLDPVVSTHAERQTAQARARPWWASAAVGRVLPWAHVVEPVLEVSSLLFCRATVRRCYYSP